MNTKITKIGTDVAEAAACLKAGQLVGMPTETVYGLAGNALDADVVLKIFEAKNRPQFDPLIVHTHAINEVEKYVSHLPAKAQLLFEHFSPGPLSLLLNKKNNIPDVVTSGLPTVAFRIPNHTLTLQLLKQLDFPLAAPSANPFGYISPTTAQHVANQLRGKLAYILDGGPSTVGIESTIIGFENEQVIIHRLGGIAIEAIEQVVGKVKVMTQSISNPSAPGMLLSHYAPSKRLLFGHVDEQLMSHNPKAVSVISFSKVYAAAGATYVLSEKGSLAEAAKHLFAAMRQADTDHSKIIVAEEFPNEGLGRAINDRLQRAAHK